MTDEETLLKLGTDLEYAIISGNEDDIDSAYDALFEFSEGAITQAVKMKALDIIDAYNAGDFGDVIQELAEFASTTGSHKATIAQAKKIAIEGKADLFFPKLAAESKKIEEVLTEFNNTFEVVKGGLGDPDTNTMNKIIGAYEAIKTLKDKIDTA